MMYYMVDFCIHSPVPSSFSLYRVQTGHPFLLSCIGFLFCIWYLAESSVSSAARAPKASPSSSPLQFDAYSMDLR